MRLFPALTLCLHGLILLLLPELSVSAQTAAPLTL